MKPVVSLFLLLSLVFLIKSENTKDKWYQFKLAHGKFYETPQEEGYRYQVFQENLKTIEEHNKKYEAGLTTWYMGINHFADMTDEEFQRYLSSSNSQEKVYESNVIGEFKPSASQKFNFPARLDLRDYLNRVRNQGQCGCCYAFTTTGTVEGHYAIKYRERIVLSPQNIVDCTNTTTYHNGGAHYGNLDGSFRYIRDVGIMTEDEYSFNGTFNECRFNSSEKIVKIKGYNTVKNEESHLIDALNEKGPLAVAIDAKEWKFYDGGVFVPEKKFRNLTHGGVLSGYGYTSGTRLKYWIIRNSWGKWWGESGDIKVSRDLTEPYHIGIGIKDYYNPAYYPEF